MSRFHVLGWCEIGCLLALGSCGGGASSGPSNPVATVTVAPSGLTLVLGQSEQLTATLRDAGGNLLSGRSVTWAASPPTVVTISTAGLLTSMGAGSATVSATSEGKVGNATFTVITLALASVSTGGAHTCGLTAVGAAYCWGRGESGQLGASPPTVCPLPSETGTINFPCSLAPLAVQGGLTFTQLDGGEAHTCALTADGSAYCWGKNNAGQLGNGTTTNSSVPVLVSGGIRFASLDVGVLHTCGVTSGGTTYCWGANGRGQLGDGTTTNSPVPVGVSGGLTLQSVTAGGYAFGHTCGLTSGGAAFCWGSNDRAQLGTGTSDLNAHPAPAPVAGGRTFTALTVGLGSHTCGLTSSGAAYCWGANDFGALGNGTSTDSPVPIPVSGGHVFVQVVAGGFIGHTCGRTSDGTAFCWGENERGAIGDGSTVDRLTPAAVTGGLAFTSLVAGFRHTCGRASTGAVYCWGSGGAGQLGINSTSQKAIPVKVLGQP